MLRTYWVATVALFATIPLASLVLLIAAIRSTSPLIDPVIRFWARILLRAAGIDLRSERMETIDRKQRPILAANRHSYFDTPVAGAAADPLHGEDQPLQDSDLRLGGGARGLHPHRPQESPHGGEVVRPRGGTDPQGKHDRRLPRGGAVAEPGDASLPARRVPAGAQVGAADPAVGDRWDVRCVPRRREADHAGDGDDQGRRAHRNGRQIRTRERAVGGAVAKA